jgi:hypothetical protein
MTPTGNDRHPAVHASGRLFSCANGPPDPVRSLWVIKSARGCDGVGGGQPERVEARLEGKGPEHSRHETRRSPSIPCQKRERNGTIATTGKTRTTANATEPGIRPNG